MESHQGFRAGIQLVPRGYRQDPWAMYGNDSDFFRVLLTSVSVPSRSNFSWVMGFYGGSSRSCPFGRTNHLANGAAWYEAFIKKLKVNGPKDVATGVFGAMMQVSSARESRAKGSA